MLPSRAEITDLAVLLMEESDDLTVVRPALISTLDLLIEPQDYQEQVEALMPPGVPKAVVAQALKLAEYGSDLVIVRVVDRVLQDMADPEARKSWLAEHRERLAEISSAGKARRAQRRRERKARRAA